MLVSFWFCSTPLRPSFPSTVVPSSPFPPARCLLFSEPPLIVDLGPSLSAGSLIHFASSHPPLPTSSFQRRVNPVSCSPRPAFLQQSPLGISFHHFGLVHRCPHGDLGKKDVSGCPLFLPYPAVPGPLVFLLPNVWCW